MELNLTWGLRNALVRMGGAIASVAGAPAGKRALAFHDVPDPARFADLLDRLLGEYEVLAMEDWLGCPVGDRTQLTLTFDDGYSSWHETVAPLLRERGVPACFFVASGLVGLSGEAARTFARTRMRRYQELELIGLDQLGDLAAEPLFEIGSHTRNHADLGRIADRRTVEDEIAGDRARLEDWLGTQVRWFAYPFGMSRHLSVLARSILDEAGISAAFTLVPGWWDPSRGDRLAIGRDGPDPALPYAVWRAWLRGGYDRLYSWRAALASSRSIASKTADSL
jgi:peptidoglycan/xylan/chitin deacetylase (PgdA/CDA1 family)